MVRTGELTPSQVLEGCPAAGLLDRTRNAVVIVVLAVAVLGDTVLMVGAVPLPP